VPSGTITPSREFGPLELDLTSLADRIVSRSTLTGLRVNLNCWKSPRRE